MKIALDKILVNPEQPRHDFTNLDSLAKSIKEYGLITPISVEENGELFILVDGERRVRASRLAGLKEIEANVKPALNGREQSERLLLAMIANLQREDVNPVEEAEGYRRMQEMGIKVEQIAQMVGKNVSVIYRYMTLLSFEPEIQVLFAKRYLPLSSQVIAKLQALPDEIRVPLAQGFARRGSTAQGILGACTRIMNKYSGSQEKVKGDFGPGLQMAYKHATTRKMIGQWNALAHVKNAPPWPVIQVTAMETCKLCAIADMASESSCKDCPLIDFLRILMEGAK